MKLANSVLQYYKSNLESLPFDKQFHFASRLHAWSGDNDCTKLVESYRAQLLPTSTPVNELLQNIINNPPESTINAAEARAPYFAKYPELRGLMLALFRVRHLFYYYGADARRNLVDIKPYNELHTLAITLSQDEEAMRILSTYAVNYIYLVEHILYDVHSGVINLEAIYKLGDAYDVENKNQLLLLIYLYTHCIIGETNFYERSVMPARKPGYLKMIKRLETVISQHFENINLDNKLEYLVCCKILGYESNLQDLIHDECNNSLSPEGTFLIDTVNKAAQASKTSFSASEHRNVLFIMSTQPYQHLQD